MPGRTASQRIRSVRRFRRAYGLTLAPMEYAMSKSVPVLFDPDTVLAAYHRAVARERTKTGLQWPSVRAACVHEDGTITDTRMVEPELIARWSCDVLGRVHVKLA